MAGIGFELQKLLKQDTYLNSMRAYTYAGTIISGPWIISVIALIGFEIIRYFEPSLTHQISQYQTSIIYLISSSLIFSSVAHYDFSRFVADRIFEKRYGAISPNFTGLFMLMTILSGLFAYVVAGILFSKLSLMYQVLMAATFVVLNGIWILSSLLSGLKDYRAILFTFILGYGLSVIFGFTFRYHGYTGLLLGFFIGQFVLLSGLLLTLFRSYPSDKIIDFEFLQKKHLYFSYILASLFFNLGLWADKYMFWFYHTTSYVVIAPLRASLIYDVPMLLAYLTIIPGMAIFLFYIETDFVDYYQNYFGGLCKGDSLSDIVDMRYFMISSAKRGAYSLLKIQAMVAFTVMAMAPIILNALNISIHYEPLLDIDVVGAAMLVVFMAFLNMFSYLDKRFRILFLTALFLSLNIILTYISLRLGIFYFGYGFAISLLTTNILCFYLLDRDFNKLEYDVFTQAI